MELKMKDIRKERGLTQEALANAVGATKRQIGAWERGENDLPMDFASAIADELKCSVDDLAGRKIEYAFMAMPKPVEPLGDVHELIDLYGGMTDEGRRQLMIYARGLAATYPKNTADSVPA